MQKSSDTFNKSDDFDKCLQLRHRYQEYIILAHFQFFEKRLPGFYFYHFVIKR